LHSTAKKQGRRTVIDIEYRAVTDSDTDALAALGRDSFCDAFAHLYTAENLNMFLEKIYAPASIASEIANPDKIYRVAVIDGEFAGYCKLSLQTSFTTEVGDDLADRNIMDLSQLYIRGDVTGHKIGDALTRWALNEARLRKYDDVLLSVYSENYRAHRFYARYGFTKYADTYFMVGNHRDEEFLYRLQLAQ
jgi:diamine N-acetyltransferase